MPPPNRNINRPTVTRPAVQRTTSLTSTDTWNKPTTTVQFDSKNVSTRSTVPGVQIKQNNGAANPPPQRKPSGSRPGANGVVGSGPNRKTVKPLPGAKLKPLLTNQDVLNTWDPKNRPLAQKKAKLSVQEFQVPSKVQRTEAATPSSRSSSVTSNKTVLPGIKKTDSFHENSHPPSTPAKVIQEESPAAVEATDATDSAKVAVVEEPTLRQAAVVQDSRVSKVKSRDISTAKLRRATAQETQQTDKIHDYFIPEWYKTPLVKPELMKGGITVFCSVVPSTLVWHGMEAIRFYLLRTMKHVQDIKAFMEKSIEKSLLTLTYFPEKEKDEDVAYPSLSKEMAEKLNSLTSVPHYRESFTNPDVFHLMLSVDAMTPEDKKIVAENVDFDAYCLSIAEGLGIKRAKDVAEIQTMINKSQKRRINIQKQERALHPHVYMETFETEDVWNHVYLCHTLTEKAFARPELMEKVRSVITTQIPKTGSPVIVHGGKKSGKTWLSAQLPAALGENINTLVRFCGLTRLTQTLPKLLRGLSKQLHVIYKSQILPRTIDQFGITEIFEMFREILNEVSRSEQKPLVLVLDSVDKLALSSPDLSKFITHCKNWIPSNVAVVLTFTSPEEDNSDMHDPNKSIQMKVINKLLEEMVVKESLTRNVALNEYPEWELYESMETNPSFLEHIQKGGSEELLARFDELHNSPKTKNTEQVLAIAKEKYEIMRKMIEISMSYLDLPGKEKKEAVIKETVKEKDGEDEEDDEDDGVEEVDEDEETRAALLTFKEQLEKYDLTRKTVLEGMDEGMIKFKEECDHVEDHTTHCYQSLISQDNEEGSLLSLYIPTFSTEEAVSFIRQIAIGKLDSSQISTLEKVTEYVHNPFLLRLIVNSCELGLPAETVLKNFKKTYADEKSKQNIFSKLALLSQNEKTSIAKGMVVKPHGLPHLLVAGLVCSDPIVYERDELAMWIKPEIASLFKFTEAERLFTLTVEDELNDKILSRFYAANHLLEDCRLDIYEQSDSVTDVELVTPFLQSILRSSCGLVPMHGLGILLTQVDLRKCAAHCSRAIMDFCCISLRYYPLRTDDSELPMTVNGIMGEMHKDIEEAMDHLATSWLSEDAKDTKWDTIEEVISDYMSRMFASMYANHEADSWEDVVKHLDEDQDSGEEESDEAPAKRAPVTSGKDKGYPQGRWKINGMNFLEKALSTLCALKRSDDDTEEAKDPLFLQCTEMLLHYDFLVPLLHEYGVDYVINSYGAILELYAAEAALSHVVYSNQTTLELLCNLLITYMIPLRENPSSFYTLFLSMFDEDLCLTSRASLRLYRRVKHEVDTRNNLHLITMLSKTSAPHLLSADTKRYLQRTSDKYGASQCVSNASYVLSHNKNNLVKLWELTGEFISAQKLDGRIVAVCAQREAKCFLAVVENVSEVGQKFASVWQIDRLTHKKVAELGSRTILSAWFDSKGEKLLLAEQCSVDEIRVVVCIPKTMEVKLQEGNVTILPLKRTSFMNKTLAVPHKIDKELLEIVKEQFSGEKKDSEATELDLYKPNPPGDGLELLPVVADRPLIFSSLLSLWDDLLEKFDAKDDITSPMEEIRSESLHCKELVNKLRVTIHGMTSVGDVVVDCQFTDDTHTVYIYKLDNDDQLKLNHQLHMDERATMTLMPSDDFVYSDTGSNAGLISWNLPTNDTKVFGNEHKDHVTCLQFEVEEKQILSFTRGQVTVWNALNRTTESSFTLDKQADVVAACLQDDWLVTANREGELTIRFEIRKKMATYHFHEPIDWIDSHVIGDNLYIACHLNGEKPTLCFLTYRVSDAPLYEPGKYVVRS